MIFACAVLSVVVAFAGLRYMICAAKASRHYDRIETTGLGIYLVIISALLLAVSYVGMIK